MKINSNTASNSSIGFANRSESHLAPSGEGIVSASLYRRLGKRCFDIVLALLLAPIIAPIICVLCLIVRRDGGKGLYAQKRIGMNGVAFSCYKLRSMHVDAEKILADLCESDPETRAEWDQFQKLKNDPRITRIGHFIRKTSLDELPQLWNVLKGDMSFVGPRPFMDSQSDIYVSAGGRNYFKTRPGITGLWQIEGRGTTTFIDRVKFDNAYYERQSFGLDLRLIAQTARVVIKNTGA